MISPSGWGPRRPADSPGEDVLVVAHRGLLPLPLHINGDPELSFLNDDSSDSAFGPCPGPGHSEDVTLLGCTVPAAALRHKCGSVWAAVLLYAVYPVVFYTGMFALVLVSDRCARGHLPGCLRTRTGGHSGSHKPGSEDDVAVWLWAVSCAGICVFHTLVSATTLLSPTGMTTHSFVQALAQHPSLFGRTFRLARVGFVLFSVLFAVSLVIVQPMESQFGHYSGTAVLLLLWLALLILPQTVVAEYPLLSEPPMLRWRVHSRRSWHLLLATCFAGDLLTALCSVNRTYAVNHWLAWLQSISLVIRTGFVLITLHHGVTSMTLSTLLDYVAIIFPSWVVAGIAFNCAGPFKYAKASLEACAPSAWVLHAFNLSWGAAAMATLLAVATGSTPLVLVDGVKRGTAFSGGSPDGQSLCESPRVTRALPSSTLRATHAGSRFVEAWPELSMLLAVE